MQKNGCFSIKEITKVEGHANLEVGLKNGVVEKCELQIYEGQRFFENMVVGRQFDQVPLITSRICGLCNVSHLNTAMDAVEKAFRVEVSEQTEKLRDLATNGEFIKSHVLHLFFLVLPDYLGKESVLDFDEKEQKYVQWALNLKKAGTEIVKLLGGRIYQTVGIRPGGFTVLPRQADLDKALEALEAQRQTAVETVKLFASFKDRFLFKRKTEYLALVSPEYSFVKGKLLFSNGSTVEDEGMLRHVHEYIAPYSSAKQTDFKGKALRVGSLARINLNKKSLEASAREMIKDLKLKFPSDEIYYNNLAQALELLHLIDSSIRLIGELKLRQETPVEIKPREATGVGVTEAPRGTLYHEYSFDSQGFVKKANIIVPTNQNNHTIEEDLKEFIPSLLNLPQEKANLEIEKVIRAYDPCISCATHFLKVNWKKKP